MRLKIFLLFIPLIVTVKAITVAQNADPTPAVREFNFPDRNVAMPDHKIPQPVPKPIFVRPVVPPAPTESIPPEEVSMATEPVQPIPEPLPPQRGHPPRPPMQWPYIRPTLPPLQTQRPVEPFVTTPITTTSTTTPAPLAPSTGLPPTNRPPFRLPQIPRPIPNPHFVRPVVTSTEFPPVQSTPYSKRPLPYRPPLHPRPPVTFAPIPIPMSTPQPQPDPIPQPQPNPQPEPHHEPQPDPTPKPQPDPIPEPKPDPQPEPHHEPEPKPQPDPMPKPQPDPIPKPKPDPQPEPHHEPEPKPQPHPIPEPQPDPIPEPKPVPQPQPLPIPRPKPDPLWPQPKPWPRPVPILPVPQPHPKPVPIPPHTYRPPTKPKSTPKPYITTTVSPSKPRPAEGVPVEFNCMEDGYYSIANECDTYVECKKRSALKYICPDGLHFNRHAFYPEYPCAYPSEVQCDSTDHLRDPQPTIQCPRQYGFFPKKGGDCSRYIMCQEGMAAIMNCPPGLAFNPQLSACDWPGNVPSCELSVFKGFSCPPAPVDEYGEQIDWIYKYKYGESCKEYVACQQGHPRLLRCDPGLAFDDESETCVDEDYVTGCEREVQPSLLK